MKTLLRIIILCPLLYAHFANPSFSQTTSKYFDLELGTTQKSNYDRNSTQILKYDGNHLFTLRTKHLMGFFQSVDFYIDIYDSRLDFVNVVKLKPNDLKRPSHFEFILDLQDQFILFSTIVNTKSKLVSLIAQEIIIETGDIRKEPITIATIDHEIDKNYIEGEFFYVFSEDKSHVLFLYFVGEGRQKNYETGFFMYDETLKNKWSDTVHFPFDKKSFWISDIVVGNDGSLVVLGSKMTDHKKDQKQVHYLFSFDQKGRLQNSRFITDPDYYFLCMKPISMSADTILCAGYFSEHGQNNNMGSYCLKLDKSNLNIISHSFYKYDLKLLVKGLCKQEAIRVERRYGMGKDYDNYDKNLIEMVRLNHEKGVLLIGEQYESKMEQSRKSGKLGTSGIYSLYKHGDIYITYISNYGKIQWTKKINKKQVARDLPTNYSSYFPILMGGTCCFLYNDNSANLNLEKGECRDEFNNEPSFTKILSSIITPNGITDRYPIFLDKEDHCMIEPDGCLQISENELIILLQTMRDYTFGKLTIKLEEIEFEN
jgi:hypothetical protein